MSTNNSENQAEQYSHMNMWLTKSDELMHKKKKQKKTAEFHIPSEYECVARFVQRLWGWVVERLGLALP